mgnify:CR=1 FL=1
MHLFSSRYSLRVSMEPRRRGAFVYFSENRNEGRTNPCLQLLQRSADVCVLIFCFPTDGHQPEPPLHTHIHICREPSSQNEVNNVLPYIQFSCMRYPCESSVSVPSPNGFERWHIELLFIRKPHCGAIFLTIRT